MVKASVISFSMAVFALKPPFFLSLGAAPFLSKLPTIAGFCTPHGVVTVVAPISLPLGVYVICF